MYADENALIAKRKSTGRVVCLIAALFVVVPLFMQWFRAPGGIDMGMNLWSLSACGEAFGGETRCESVSNFELARMMRKAKEGQGVFAYAGIATLVLSLAGAAALAAAGGLAFKDRFIREPVALTTVALLALCAALLAACIFLGAKPRGPLSVSWPFFVYAAGIVGGLAGAQMLSKAFGSPPDPYWDGIAPEPPDPV